MPTGYTITLVEKGQSFKDFTLTCAKAFGALVEMRDDSLDTPIPEKFEASKYYQEKLSEAKKELDTLESQPSAASLEQMAKKLEERKLELKKSFEEAQAQNLRIYEMIKHVEAWQPPTQDHKGLKDFMLKQLTISINDTKWYEQSINDLNAKTPQTMLIETLASLQDNIIYYNEQGEKEYSRTSERNEWISQLRKSLEHVNNPH